MDKKDNSSAGSARTGRRAILLLLIIPFIGTLWVPSYAFTAPELWGIPFFYWYQFLWIAIGAAITIVVYLVEPSARTTRGDGQ
jgi:hypothetical protein